MNVIKNSMSFRETGNNEGRDNYRKKNMINAGYLYPSRFEEL